jgi:hypothetical protein
MFGATPNALAMLGAGALLVGTVTANASPVSPYVVTLEQQGLNVVATGAGEFDLSGLSSAGLSASLVPEIDAPLPRIITGVGGQMDLYTGATGPNSFGTGSEHSADSASGDSVGVSDPTPTHYILVPQGYVSGTALSDSATYDNATFATLGVTPGTYRWTWGSDADQSFTLEIGPVATPLPAALPLFGSALGALGLLGWRRKRKALAA